MSDEEIARLRRSCRRALTHHQKLSPHEALRQLATDTPRDLAFDVYGAADWLGAFEKRIASELGKEAAVFMPTGTLAQQTALRIWCDRAKHSTIAFHPTCHLEIHESRAYSLLHGLHALLVGAPSRLMTVADVNAIADPIGAFVIELPQREIGAQLPAWGDLIALCDAARATGAKLHLDGARLWEAAPFYARPHAEIAALFDSVYVSFYKGLGALAARVWQHRHGGRPVTIAPYAISAERGFERHVAKMPAYRDRAIEIAGALRTIDGVDVVPDPPQTNHFHAYLRGAKHELEMRAHAYARETGTFVFGRLSATLVPTVQKWEFVVGDATLQLTVDEAARAVRATMHAPAHEEADASILQNPTTLI